jgi:O-antigen/teichoic acid export membrane protein
MAPGEGFVTSSPDKRPLTQIDTTSSLAAQTFTYAVSGMVAPALAVITLPIFARVLTKAEYGVVELGMTLGVLILTITDAGLIAASHRSYFDYGDDRESSRRAVLSTAFACTTALAILAAVAVALFSDQLSEWLFGQREATVVALVAATILPLNTLRFVTGTMRIRFQARLYFVTLTAGAVLSSVLGVVAVVVFDLAAEGVFAAAVLANAASAAYGLFVVRRALSTRFSTDQLRKMLAYGLPLVPANLAAWALALVDRVILGKLRNLDDVGQYAIATRLGFLLLIGMNALMLALGPFLLSTFSQDPALEKLARGRILTYLTFVLSFCALGVALFASELIEVLAPAYDDAYKAVGPLAMGTVVYGIATLLVTGISLARRTIFLAVFGLLAAGVNVALNFALIPPFGIVGAALAYATGYVFLAGSYYVIAQRVYPTPYEPVKAASILFVASALSPVGVLQLDSEALEIALKLAALVVFAIAVRATGAMTNAEFTELRRFLAAMIPARPRRAG